MKTLDPSEALLDRKYVLVRLGEQLFGIPAILVSEMTKMPALTPLPKSSEAMRGVFMLRGQSIAALDLRLLMGMPSAAEELDEFREMLLAREQDHRNWIAELEASVNEGRPFTLATDPHKCAFGRWYDTYKSPSVLIASHLKKFDAPHRRIHAVAQEVAALLDQGETEMALTRIEETRTFELAEMISLFAEFHELLNTTRREIAVVIGDHDVSYCVDVVEGVQDIAPLQAEDSEISSTNKALEQRGLTPTVVGPDREVVLLMNRQRLPGLDCR